MDAYLDIETTGLSPFSDTITVVGVYRETPEGFILRQLVGHDVTRLNLTAVLDGVKHLYTYNGDRFDLVFIQSRLGLELKSLIEHTDLMRACWCKGLYGGFKAVERQLGIERTLQGVSGRDAVDLWWRYIRRGDNRALRTLLDYNREDVVNLKALRERLGGEQPV
ncbi:MAG: ribonuclease H-like domain-containing protein [Dehalococcoidia bacterium]|jgi:hypothetical protein|nr:ribonuclease H-like domain-containing protein [Dehalococcoidia bacterium]